MPVMCRCWLPALDEHCVPGSRPRSLLQARRLRIMSRCSRTARTVRYLRTLHQQTLGLRGRACKTQAYYLTGRQYAFCNSKGLDRSTSALMMQSRLHLARGRL